MIRAMLLASLLMPAHMNYPTMCCGNQDCSPVACDDLVETNSGIWVYLPTGNRFQANQVWPTEDRNCHVCMGRIDKRSICAFVQHGS